MFSFDFNENQAVIALGLSILALVFILRSTAFRSWSTARRQPLSQRAGHDDALEFGSPTIAKKREIRLSDFAREVEGRAQMKIAVLDRLIADADREIIRLEQVLADSRPTGMPVAGKSRRPDAIVPQDRRDAA